VGMTVKAWPPKVGKTVWILDKQPYQRERMSQPSDGKALCLVGALWGLTEQGASRLECGLVHLALCSSPGRFMMGPSMDARVADLGFGAVEHRAYALRTMRAA